jgi:heme oxygenase
LELRAGTQAEHARVDNVFGAFDLATLEGYRSFLAAQADALVPLELALDAAGADTAVADWASRHRSDLLKADLADLGADIPHATSAPTIESPEAVLGALYVLEGSRLGGTVLARTVPLSFPKRFLSASDPARWRSLIQLIDHNLVFPDQLAVALQVARDVFGRFEAAGRKHAKALLLEQ